MAFRTGRSRASVLTAVEEVAAISAQVRSARSRRAPLRIVGAATWLDAGRQREDTTMRGEPSERVNIGALSGVVSYEPGDLTLTVRAGTSLAGIAHVTSAEGQWLPLEPLGPTSGTIGATVATASWGPLASAFGTPRDQVLGCEFVSGTGDIVRAGGRVVKNVAGFDLVRLMTGSWGTLGAITEVTIRLRSRPEQDDTLAVRVPGDTEGEQAATAWRWVRGTEYSPFAAEMISPALGRRLATEPGASLLVRLGGNSTFVRAARNAVTALGAVSGSDPSVWQRLALAEMPGSVVVRVSTRPSRVGELWGRASRLADGAGGYAHATLARGIVRCVLPKPTGAESVPHLGALIREISADATLIGERLPAPLWHMRARSTPIDTLARDVRRAFDPDGVMNGGILGGLA